MIYNLDSLQDLDHKVISIGCERVIGTLRSYDVYHLEDDTTLKTVPPIKWVYKERYPDRINFEINELMRGYSIQTKLHKEGVSVPKTRGAFTIDYEKMNDISLADLKGIFGIIMDTVHGMDGCRFESRLENKEREVVLRDIEIQKAQDLGFIPGNDTRHNYIYLPDEDKVVLIDFNRWKFPLPPKKNFWGFGR